MIYINPLKEFTEDYIRLVKVQIDNSIRTWDRKDILLVTNFPYSYGGINSIVVPDDLFCNHRKRASKINVICHMMDNYMVDDMCWFHDFDAYQVDIFPEDILGNKDAAFTDYGFNTMWNTGSFFFTQKARDIFELIRQTMNARVVNEEIALRWLTSRNINNINERYIKLNNTYNLGRMRHNELTFKKADKPIKVFHFHPRMTQLYEEVKPLLPDHLIGIFEKHGY
ncbi:MAG: hypothetical protein HYW79_00295 [Parcubacteria group bacterium]|nr:hypothetical protein [Parcubacteria group bacterium]